MAHEGMPSGFENEPTITDTECMEAMKAHDFDRVREWYDQRAGDAEADPTARHRLRLALRLGELQAQTNYRDEAFSSFQDALDCAERSNHPDLVEEIRAAMQRYSFPPL